MEIWDSSLGHRMAAASIPEPSLEEPGCGSAAGVIGVQYFAAAVSCNLNDRFWSRLFVWDSTGHQVASFDNTGNVSAVALSPNGEYVGALSTDNAVRIWRVHDRTLALEQRQPKEAEIIAFSTDSRYAATAGENDTLRIWDVPAALEVAQLDCCSESFVEFDPNGTDILVGRPPVERITWNTKRLVERACAHVIRNLDPKEFLALLPGEAYRRTCPDVTAP